MPLDNNLYRKDQRKKLRLDADFPVYFVGFFLLFFSCFLIPTIVEARAISAAAA